MSNCQCNQSSNCNSHHQCNQSSNCNSHHQCNQGSNCTGYHQCNQTNNCTNHHQCNQNHNCSNGGCTGTASMPGGWSTDYKSASSISPSLYTCFTNALNSQVGVKYTILSYLGSQIVSGTNYALLCCGTTVTNPPTTQLYLVIIYKDLNGNCSISSSTPVLG